MGSRPIGEISGEHHYLALGENIPRVSSAKYTTTRVWEIEAWGRPQQSINKGYF